MKQFEPLSLTLLAPAAGRESEGPVFVPAFGSMAETLPLLDYLTEDCVAGLGAALRALRGRGSRWTRSLQEALDRFASEEPELVSWMDSDGARR